jgi:predicted amidohydrolase
MKIGFVQFAPVLGDPGGTMSRMDRLIPRGKDADLLVLPELCNSGYNFQSKTQAWETSEQIENSRFVRYLQSRCQEYDLYIVSGFNERDEGILYNSAILVGPHGCIGKYRKLHLFKNEKDYFQSGNLGLPVFDIGWCRVGMLVCFDWIFPEAPRVLALRGADIICHPSNLVLPGYAQKAMPVHALVNRVYVVTANRIGSEGELSFTGCSIMANPRGEVIAQASRESEDVEIREVDVTLARDKMITERNHLFEDRRPRAYALLTDTTRETS